MEKISRQHPLLVICLTFAFLAGSSMAVISFGVCYDNCLPICFIGTREALRYWLCPLLCIKNCREFTKSNRTHFDSNCQTSCAISSCINLDTYRDGEKVEKCVQGHCTDICSVHNNAPPPSFELSQLQSN
ncbi:hypothetical protein ACFE04_031656 [Oxalis oulophora]